jgi:hypothetical protein
MPRGYLVTSVALLLGITAASGGCARVPAESVRLNQAVGGRLDDLRQRHVNLARSYLDLKREKFDDWFMSDYEPAFRQQYATAWIARRGAAFDPADEASHRQYTRDVIAEYEELASQLRESQQQFLSRLDAGYADASQANAAVGALLQSASDLHEAERKFWDGSVGRVLPGARAEALDRALEELQAAALRGLGSSSTQPSVASHQPSPRQR